MIDEDLDYLNIEKDFQIDIINVPSSPCNL